MKVFLKKDIEKIGIAGEVIKVTDGYARNFLFPRGLAVAISETNEEFFKQRAKKVEHRKEVIANETSMLAEKISAIKITLKEKIHDDGKLFGAINAREIVEALEKQGVSISKNQVVFEKPIKTKGSHDVIIKLTSRLMPKVKVIVIPE